MRAFPVRTIGQNSLTWQLEIGTHPYLQMISPFLATLGFPGKACALEVAAHMTGRVISRLEGGGL